MTEVLATAGDYRVSLEYDETPAKPYDDGATPILELESNGYSGYRVTPFNSQADDYFDSVQAVVSALGLEAAERYLRIFHGARATATFWSNGLRGYYLAFDTDEWAARVGCPDEYRAGAASAALSEVEAWANGEVYGYVLERRAPYVKTFASGETEEGEDWEEVESCWGFYGQQYAESEALAVLASYAKEA